MEPISGWAKISFFVKWKGIFMEASGNVVIEGTDGIDKDGV